MSSGDKMAPFLVSEMAWICQMIFLSNATFITAILIKYLLSLFVYQLIQGVPKKETKHTTNPKKENIV